MIIYQVTIYGNFRQINNKINLFENCENRYFVTENDVNKICFSMHDTHDIFVVQRNREYSLS